MIILTALIGPFLVWPIEFFLPYPYIVEEVFKAFLVYFNKDEDYKTFIYAGILFALTETVLYSVNINLFGDLKLFFVRFAATSLLHSFTFLVLFYFAKRGNKMFLLGILSSFLIHYLYNLYIPIY